MVTGRNILESARNSEFIDNRKRVGGCLEKGLHDRCLQEECYYYYR